MTLRRKITALILFIVVSSVYFATARGINSSNDGSHFSLLRAMVDEGRFEIETYRLYTEDIDYAIRDGVFYSDRPPGTALLAAPFYAVGDLLPNPQPMPSKYDPSNLNIVYMMMAPALAGAALTAILYVLLLSYQLSEFAALTTSLAFAFGSTSWRYGSLLFSHVFSGLLVLAAIALILWMVRQKKIPPAIMFLTGLVAGMSVVVEYANAVFFIIAMVYFAVRMNRALITQQRWWLSLTALVIGAALPIGFLIFYNATNFGGPFTTSYSYSGFEWARSLRTTFVMPLSQGLPGMLWYGEDGSGIFENQGIFLFMPVTLLGLVGVWFYVRAHWREGVLVLGVFIFYLLLFASHRTFGTSTADSRYLMPYLSLWFIPTAYGIHVIYSRITEQNLKAAALFIIYGLIFLSVRNMLGQISLFYNYSLDFSQLSHPFASPRNWNYITGIVFSNADNVPLFVALQVVVIALIWGGIQVYLRTTNQSPGLSTETSSAETTSHSEAIQ